MYIIPYMLPMLLGRTYDYNTGLVGLDIFDPNNVTKFTRTIQSPFTRATYKLVKSAKDINDLMDIKGELSLQVNGGTVNVQGMGSYMKQKSDKENQVELLCRVKYETITKTLDTAAPPLPLWDQFPRQQLGTHFVRSITYGGELIASLTFKAESYEAAQEIEAQVSLEVGIEGTLDLGASGRFEKLEKNLKEGTRLEIKYYGTVPVTGVAQDLSELQTLTTNFSEAVKSVNNGQGNPIRVEIVPLNTLFRGRGQLNFLRNTGVAAMVDDINQKYDDVLTAEHELRSWVSSLGDLQPDIVEQISKFSLELDKVNAAFYETVLKLDISSTGKTDQFDNCLKLYKGNSLYVLPGKFMRKFRELRKSVTERLERDTFSNPMTNIGVFKENVVDMGMSFKKTGAMTVEKCKQYCRADDQCKSITYYLTKGSTGVLATTNDMCYVNHVGQDDGELVPVPHLGQNSVRIYLRGKNFTWDTTVPKNFLQSLNQELASDDDLLMLNTQRRSDTAGASLELDVPFTGPAPPPPATQFCPKSKYHVMCNDTTPMCFAALCEDAAFGNGTAICTDLMRNVDAQCMPCCNYPASRGRDALILSCHERNFYTQCRGEALCLEHSSTARGGTCVGSNGNCRRKFYVYGKTHLYTFCKGVYQYTGTECPCPSG